MNPSPLSRTVVEIVGVPFHVLATPEDGVVRAAGFATESDPEAHELEARLAALDPALAARGVSDASEGGTIAAALGGYAGGDPRALDALAVAQPETPFRGEVRRALRRVRAGRAVSYTELASLAGRPAAVRAAASACATNLVALIVPCHRIVRSDGGMGGYLFGTELKQRLLAFEGAMR